MTTGASNSITIRLEIKNSPGMLSNVISSIAEQGGNVGAIDIIKSIPGAMVRDITIDTSGEDHAGAIQEGLASLEGIRIVNVSDRTFLMHLGGKISVENRYPVTTRDELSMAYTPGVARVCEAIHKDPSKSFDLTIRKNTVAIVSDGTAVLGLGDIGPEAAMPVMEGKAMLFKSFAGVDAFPICLAEKDTDKLVDMIKALAPTFGGINLEDISAPRCFEIERRLKAELDIPIFHDDQHGTAVVMVAAFINALKVVNKKAQDLKVVCAGVGAAGTACTKMLLDLGVKNIIGVDRKGSLYEGRDNMNAEKVDYASYTNPQKIAGSLKDVMHGADVFIGVSGPNLIDEEDLKNMAPKAIVFAMSNPTPEVMPEIAWPHVAVMATGRSDYPNQINNVLCFPGMFKGAFRCHAREINEEMKMAAAIAIASVIKDEELGADYIIPSVFDKKVATAVAKAVREAAIATGAARKSK